MTAFFAIRFNPYARVPVAIDEACPLDHFLLDWKGVKYADVRKALEAGATDEAIATLMDSHGTKKTPAEVKAWSDKLGWSGSLRKSASIIRNPAGALRDKGLSINSCMSFSRPESLTLPLVAECATYGNKSRNAAQRWR